MFAYILFQQQPVMLADSSIIHTQFHQPHVLVPANPYLHEGKEKKYWLKKNCENNALLGLTKML